MSSTPLPSFAPKTICRCGRTLKPFGDNLKCPVGHIVTPCPACEGTGDYSRCYDVVGSSDLGEQGYVKRGQTETKPCKKCRGQGLLRNEFPNPKI